jgi:hypothetical protein
MSFGYTSFKRQLEDTFQIDFVKKDMMAKTKGPQMRVSVMKIRRRVEDLDESILNPIPVEQT